MKAWVGTSGWQYGSWRGPFYPPEVPQRAWLRHYAERFPVVEVNNTFYMLPKAGTVDRWRAETPDEFRFVVKASRYITHIRRLREVGASIDLFWSRAARLGPKLGPILFQFPPTFRRDEGLLAGFLDALPAGMRAAVEFREGSWAHQRVFDLLEGAGAAWVLADRPGWRVPSTLTGGWTYVRFHQGRAAHPGYARTKLRAWADRIVELGEQGATEAFAFFNNDAWAAAPADAATFTRLLSERGVDVSTAGPA